MSRIDRRRLLSLGLPAAGLLVGCRTSARAAEPREKVRLEKTPDGGVQPQALIDARGVVHLVYLTGKPGASDVIYRRRPAGETAWSAPIRVNSQPGSAVAAGSIRGAQLALGKGDRVHVVWNGSMETSKNERGAPLLYSRLNDPGTAFEPQRDVSRSTADLDGGASIAADTRGNVYVAWHAAPGKGMTEGDRRLWLTRSVDEGRTFGAEETVWQEPAGACACCSVKVFADREGAVHLLYRAATERVNRDMVFLLSGPGGAGPFRGGRIDPWVINACPMASESLVDGPEGVWAAWETEGQVRLARVGRHTRSLGPQVSAPGPAQGRKHPALAVNSAGEVLLAWDEGTGWQRGGALAWQLYGRTGEPLPQKGRVAGAIPVWGLSTAVALPDGSFLIIH